MQLSTATNAVAAGMALAASCWLLMWCCWWVLAAGCWLLLCGLGDGLLSTTWQHKFRGKTVTKAPYGCQGSEVAKALSGCWLIVTIRCIIHDSFTLHAVKPVQPGWSQEEQAT